MLFTDTHDNSSKNGAITPVFSLQRTMVEEWMMAELDGKVAMVTGAGRLRGIGRASALALARLGADVVLTGTGRDPASFPDDEKAVNWKDVESSAEQVRALGRRALPLVFDVTDREQVDKAVADVLAEFGRIDILINNAAIARGEDRVAIADLDTELFQRVVDVKVRGTFLCTQAVVRQLYVQDEGGKIVNISSVAGKRGSANTLAYNAANFAIVGMTQSMARELGPSGINVNCVCPGAVATSRMDAVSPDNRPVRSRPSDPVGRWGSDDEVGEFVAYLCTEAASWIHGQSINQDGGAIMEH
ncbi:MAG: SDR family oxidoreductase [Pseudomonadales bacterium]|jgi:NAD(P)-dependent dehydrogenase (short-subunit alcohol dehydrogenase family)|nr:SDR family oxidoreductase [Pseudomonadales bacterium]|tara:strand:+ start:29 stop:934 length:906 start_codon:yes stop_codon:yes gene_type:complete